MAFEIYDDIAFFWFFETILFVALVPFTYHMVGVLRHVGASVDDLVIRTANEKAKWEKISNEKRRERRRKIFSFKTFVFVVMWVAFLYGMMQVANYQHEKLATFEPYEILELTPGASEQEIKKAYRKLSLLYHPDKNPTMEHMFMLVSKAHQTLTDEVTRLNWEKYGNPDGYQGTSVTIGLPSSLLKRENELGVLIIYFLIIVVLPPVCVGMWWSTNRRVHETGVFVLTTQIFWHYLDENTPTKALVEVLCAAKECDPTSDRKLDLAQIQVDAARIYKDIKEDLPNQGKPRTKIQYAPLGMVLVYAHLLRDVRGLQKSTREYLDHILRNCHRLMAVMLDITAAKRRYYKLIPVRCLMELSQHIVQAVYFDQSSLYQLPHMSPDIVKELKRVKKGRTPVSSSEALRMLSKEDRRELLQFGLTDKQWEEIDNVLDSMPDPQLDVTWEVEDEKGLYDGDYVKVTLFASRRPDEKPSPLKKPSEEEDESALKDDDIESDDDGVFAAEQRKKDVRKKHRDCPPVPVHAPLFPDKKFERWVALLTDKDGNVHSLIKLPSLAEPQEISLGFFAQKGVHEYEVHLLCDSYLGCDREKTFRVNVKTRPQEKVVEEEEFELKDEDDDMEQKEPEMSTLLTWLDYIATAILLMLIAFGMYTYVSQKPWFISNVEPYLNQFLVVISPVTDKLAEVFAPVISLWSRFVSPWLHVERSEPIKINPEKMRQWSQRTLL